MGSPLSEHPDEGHERYFVYLISCNTGSSRPVKIGKTNNLIRRLSNIQTGCPYKFTHVFTVTSTHQEEVDGLERLLHQQLPRRLRGEWYDGTEAFFEALHTLLAKINSGSFTYEEIQAVPDLNAGPELEIMLHYHEFHFAQVTLPLRRRSQDPDLRTVQAEEIVRIILGKEAPDGESGAGNPQLSGSGHHGLQIAVVTFRSRSGNEEMQRAIDLGSGRYQVMHAPCYHYGISFLDIIEATRQINGTLLFHRVIQKSGYWTLRASDPGGIAHDLIEELSRLGCFCRLITREFLVVDIPPAVVITGVTQLLAATQIDWEHADPPLDNI